MAPTPPITADPVAPWLDGAVRGWAAASEFSGLSRAQLLPLLEAGRVLAFPVGERGDWMFARRSIAEVLAAMYAAHAARGRV